MTNKTRPASEITEGLRDWSDNRRDDSADALLKLVYAELHRQAHRYLQKERVGHTLQTTALVHEAYLKLAEQKSVAWESRSHFFAIAATMIMSTPKTAVAMRAARIACRSVAAVFTAICRLKML